MKLEKFNVAKINFNTEEICNRMTQGLNNKKMVGYNGLDGGFLKKVYKGDDKFEIRKE